MNRALAILTAPLLKPAVIALWAAFLLLPFRGIRAASVLFIILLCIDTGFQDTDPIPFTIL